MPDLSLDAHLATQCSVITRGQALAAGLTTAAWDWKLTSGRWQGVLPGVAVAHSGGISFEQHTWAALLSAGKDAVLSGDVALSLAGLRFSKLSRIDLLVPHGRRVDPLAFTKGPTVTVHRARALSRLAVMKCAPPRLAPHVAALHAAAWALKDKGAEWRIAASVQQRLTTPALIRAQLAHLPQLPRRALIRAVLDDVELGAHAGTELAFLKFCRTHGLPLPDSLQLVVRHQGGKHYLDARYHRQRVTIELDGAHHAEPGQWDADALRSLRVAAHLPGEQVLRITMGNLRHDGAEVAALLRMILA